MVLEISLANIFDTIQGLELRGDVGFWNVSLNEECIFENASLMKINMNNDTNNVINMKIPLN